MIYFFDCAFAPVEFNVIWFFFESLSLLVFRAPLGCCRGWMIYRHTSTSLFSLFSRCVYYAVDRSDSLSIYAERRLFCPALAWTLEIENWWRGEAHTYAKQLTTLHLNVLVPRCKGGKKPFFDFIPPPPAALDSHFLEVVLYYSQHQ